MLHAFLGLLVDILDGLDVGRVIFEFSPADELEQMRLGGELRLF